MSVTKDKGEQMNIRETMNLISSGKKEALTQTERESVIKSVFTTLKANGIKVLSDEQERDFKERGICFQILKLYAPCAFGVSYESLCSVALDTTQYHEAEFAFGVLHRELNIPPYVKIAINGQKGV